MLLADVVGRLIGGFAEVEVGIVLAVIGGPCSSPWHVADRWWHCERDPDHGGGP